MNLFNRKPNKLNSKSINDLELLKVNSIEELINNSSVNKIYTHRSGQKVNPKTTPLEDSMNKEFWETSQLDKVSDFRDHNYYAFTNVFVNPRHGVVFLDKDSCLHESLYYTGNKKIFSSSKLLSFRQLLGFSMIKEYPRNKMQNYIEVVDAHFNYAKRFEYPAIYGFSTSPVMNYCHFNLDVLSGIIPLLDYILSGQIKLLWSGKMSEFQEGMLKQLGITEDHFVYSRSSLIRAPYLIKSSSNFHLYKKFLSSSVLPYFDYLSSNFVTESDEKGNEQKNILLIRSKDTSKRQNEWSNWDILVEKLRSRGFQLVDPGLLSIGEQISLFQNAEIIVGQHGAALTNTGYCRPGTKIIELLPNTRLTKVFYKVSKINNCQHFILTVDSERIKEGDNINSFKYITPIQKIESLIDKLSLSYMISIIKKLKKADQNFLVQSYSQLGEDTNLERILNSRFKHKISDGGFYVDVGAFHPFKYSNTYKFYKKGWKGINIEPNPSKFQLFEQYRQRDINLNIGISDKEQILKYWNFDRAAFNTFDESEAQKLIDRNDITLKEVIQVQTKTLQSVLQEYLSAGQSIEFLNIDVEGLDLMVLESFDINLYQPKLICIEENMMVYTSFNESNIYNYLNQSGYRLHCIVGKSNIYSKRI